MKFEGTHTYLSAFARFEESLNGRSGAPLHALRKSAIGRFAELGFPGTRDEAWFHTNVAPLVRTPFRTTTLEDAQGAWKSEQVFQDLTATRLVFVNGFYSAEHSRAGSLPHGVRACSLAGLKDSEADWVAGNIARHAAYDEHAFVALNTAFLQDGAVIYVPRGTAVETPIHVAFVSTASGAPSISHPRTLVLAEENSQVTIIESYTGDGAYFTNAVTEVIANDSAKVDHYKLELESPEAFHIATMQSRQGAHSDLSTHAISIGGKLVRNEVNALLAGEAGEATVNGFYLTDCEQHIDNHTLIEHAEPNCNSHELYKGILGGKSSGVFRGKIHVHRKAQETDAYQSNQSLLISEGADINTKPQLEIYADQVKCSHGATIGQLDENAVFYLRSRGLSQATAQRILVHAFAVDILNRIKPESVRNYLERIVMDKFDQVRDARNAS